MLKNSNINWNFKISYDLSTDLSVDNGLWISDPRIFLSADPFIFVHTNFDLRIKISEDQ